MDPEIVEATDEGIDEALIQEARSMGWQPKEEFKGNPDNWTEPAEYVERGKRILPIITENNRRLKNELLTTTKKLDRITQDHDKSLKALEAHFAKIAKQAVEDTKRSLKEQLKEARENGDVDLEVDTLDKLQELKESGATSERHETRTETSAEGGLSPEFQSWQDKNPWFGVDRIRSDAIIGIAKRLRDAGDDTPGEAFFDKCKEILDEAIPDHPKGRVEAGSRSGGVGSRGKSFSDLPKEAKEACWADVEDLVGPGKSYKTKADWEKAYANIYFGSAES